jgi:hypothetical protein
LKIYELSTSIYYSLKKTLSNNMKDFALQWLVINGGGEK